jgi:AGCS family alanine or glycine:cation symporter
MAVGYIILALGVVICNISEIPAVLGHIVRSAFGWEQALGGGMGAAVMQGIKRGLFSNEAGMGSAPNVAATATVSHPAKQGFIQALGVFTDTLVICTCTAFIILVSDTSADASLSGIQLTQAAFTEQVGSLGSVFVAIAILLFAFSSIIGNYYYGESNIRFISRRPLYLWVYRVLVGAMVMCGALMSLDLAWSLADVTMGLMTICNLIAIVLLSRQALWLLRDYTAKRRKGTDSPTFHKEEMPEEMRRDIECWE